MSETLFDYQTRLREEESIYLLRAIAEKLGVAPFDSQPAPQTPPLRVVEVEVSEPVEEKATRFVQYAKFDPLCRKFADDRNYFGDLVEANPNDKIAREKLDEAKSHAMHRNRAIAKMIEAGQVRYFPRTFEAEFNLDNAGTWVPWRAEFCPQTEIKKRKRRSSK